MENYLTQITNYLLTQSWQIAVLVVLIAAVNLALKNRSAHVRYLLWLIVLAKCLVPPLVTIPLAILPQDKMPEPTLISSGEMPAVNVEMKDTVTSETLALPSLAVTSPTIMERLARVTVRQWLGFGWIVGVAAFLLFALVKALRTNFWLWRQQKLPSAELQTGIENLFSGFGIKTYPKVCLVEGIGQPFVWGLLRGSIYLPADFVKVNSAEHRRGVLGHELSHVIRFDAAVNILQIIAQAIFWFHPFVWWANKKIRSEREKCCDEMAIARLGAKAKDYSSAIVQTLISEHESTRPVPSLAVAGPVKNIEERIKTMLRPGKKFYKHPSLVAATVVLFLALLTVPTAIVLSARAETKAKALPLHQAVAAGDIEQVKSLISSGADVDARNWLGQTPLHLAAHKHQEDVVILLLASGADTSSKDKQDQTALDIAMKAYYQEIARLLVAKGGEFSIHVAAFLGDIDKVKEFIKAGVSPYAKDKIGFTLLHWAAAGGNRDVAELLIAKGADVNIGEQQWKPVKWTPLHVAASTGHTNVAECLIANGANVDAGDWTPLQEAAYYSKKMVELLIAKGADIDIGSYSPVHCAVDARRKDIIELLISKGANVNARKDNGETPLHLAARYRPGMVEFLVANGADMNAKDKKGRTPMHHLIWRNHEELVGLLAAKGAD